MQRMKASDWRREFFSDRGRPSETWLREQLRAGEIPGEQIGGIWFVHVRDNSLELDYGTRPASNDAELMAESLLEDWQNGAQSA